MYQSKFLVVYVRNFDRMNKRSFLKTTLALGAIPFSGYNFSPKTNLNAPFCLPDVPEVEFWETWDVVRRTRLSLPKPSASTQYPRAVQGR